MKKDFDEKALLGLYTDYDNNIRPYFNKPFEVDGAVVATDAHMIIVLDRKSLKGNYSGNEVAPYVMEKIREIISTPVNCNKTVGREELERALSALPQVEETVEEYKTETCPECAGTGIVEWSYNGSRRYYSHESECPECDGDGVVTNEYKRKTGRETERWKQDYRRKEVVKWCQFRDCSVQRPVFSWTAQEVIDYILSHGQQPNPLYKRGFSRVGCYPCIMSRKQEVKLISQDPFGRDRLIAAEQAMKEATPKGSTFFSPTYIPKRFCANGSYPTVQEVFDYVNRDDAGMDDMFKDEADYSCMSLYHGLCE